MQRKLAATAMTASGHSRHIGRSSGCPLLLRERRKSGNVAMAEKCQNRKSPRHSTGSSCQRVEQGLCFIHIARVESFSEPAVDWRERLTSLISLALIAPELRHAHCGARFLQHRILPTRAGDGLPKVRPSSVPILKVDKQVGADAIHVIAATLTGEVASTAAALAGPPHVLLH
jgi:hypothetical protein